MKNATGRFRTPQQRARGIAHRAGLAALTALAVVFALAPIAHAQAPSGDWVDNERQMKSDDPSKLFRRSEHFRILWGKGVGKNRDENADFDKVTEQLAQGNLQMLERIWQRFHDPEPQGIGFHATGKSVNPKYLDDKLYRVNLVMNNTGIWTGGAWGSCDEWGFPLFALPPAYLRFDPPSGATPHEYGHTVIINAGGFNETPYDGMWHEATSNWLMLQFNNSYPGPGGGIQPYLSMPHGRNYYDAWLLWEYFREDPKFGYAFINKVWTQANGNKAKGGEYIFDAMARLHTAGAPDSYNAIKDAIGNMAARNVMWDYERGVFFRMQSLRTMDPFTEMYRRAYTELVRRQGDTKWFRVPFAHAPMQGGYNVVPIALDGKKGGDYRVTVDFKPLWDPIRRADWRATLVAVNDNGESRYGTMWNGGVNSITLSGDENQLYLAVAATPDFMGYEGFTHPLISDLPLQPQAYEVAFVGAQGGVYESKPTRPANASGKPHPNGAGFVADSAKVDASAYVGPNAMVLDRAQVLGNARIEDYAIVMNEAVVKDNARVSGHGLVKDRAEVSGNGKVRDWATVLGGWKVYENGRALERAYLLDRGELHGNATIKGNVPDYGNANVKGHAIKEGDCANGVPIDHQTLMCWVWGADQKYADGVSDNEALYCAYQFVRESPIYALDKHGVVHGYLMGNPQSVRIEEGGPAGALQLDGKSQYVELKRDVADFNDTTIATWIKWPGGKADQRVFHFGDAGRKYAYLTPKGAGSGKVEFVISVNGKEGEQTLTGPSALPADTWTHVAITLKGNAGTLYLDGKRVAANEKMTLDPDMVLAANTLAGNDATYLGRGPGGNHLQGLVTDFRIYIEPQEASAIATLADGIKNRGAGIVAAAKQGAGAAPGFLLPPAQIGNFAAMMSATRNPQSKEWMEYSFRCVKGGGHDSGWISSNRWTDCDLKPGTTYAYTVQARSRLGEMTPESESAAITIQRKAFAPEAGEFAVAPAGISASAIRMTAKIAGESRGFVEFQFTRNDGKKSAWQSSPTWTDKDLAAGAAYSYAVQVRDAAGNLSKPSSAKSSVARDDTPPVRYPVGEWQTYPYATVDNRISMKAMSLTGKNGCPKIEGEGSVEYFFHCVSGGGPDSNWQEDPEFKTAELPLGTYEYAFKTRDKSPQKNETPYSSVEKVRITPFTGYRPYAAGAVEAQPEGALVVFDGKVTALTTETYTVSAGGARVRVMPNTVGSKTDSALEGQDVTVQGCVWKCDGVKTVVWADVKRKSAR